MKRICAWCNKELGPKGKHESEKVITHGICSLCSLDITRGVQRTVSDILNIINEPVFLVDEEGVIKAANNSASQMLSKERSEIEERLGGEMSLNAHLQRAKGGAGRLSIA
jgi:PAS domain-containing protein